MLTENEGFDSNFALNDLSEIKTGLHVYYYPFGSQQGGRDGTIVEVSPIDGFKWIGIFALGDIARDGYNGIFSMPSKDLFCVVSRGNGFIVSATDPEDWLEVNCVPIMDVKVSKKRKLIIFSSYTELVAYGVNGIAWVTSRLSFDGLRLTSQDDDFIDGEYFDIRSNRMETFKINLFDGSHLNSLGPIEK